MRYRYRSDEELKDSGVEWLGKIPKDWNTPKISSIIETLTDYVANGSFESLAKNVNYLSEEDYAILIRTQDNSNGFKGPFVYIDEKAYNFLSKSKVYPNDIIISNVGAVGNVFKAPNLNKPMSLAPNSILIRTTQNNQYIYYLLQSSFIQEEIRNIVSSTAQPKFNKTNFRGIKTITPKEVEQEKIANFLDEKTSQFDLIISKKEKLIERLEEAKKSLISEVVTGKVKVVKSDDGYELVKRSSEEMKDSGVEWLGEIPKDWEVKYFKHMFNFKKGLSITKADLKESGVPCVSYGEIHSKYRFELNPSKQDLKYVDEEYLSTGKSSLLEYGDFIFCDTSEDLSGCGNFTYLNEYSKVFAGYHTIIARANKEINYRYMAYLFESDDWRYQIRSKVSGIKVFSITQSILKTTTVIQPSLIDQKNISDYLDIKCNGINHTINKTKLQIEKLKEAKQSLISEAVTGKIEILD